LIAIGALPGSLVDVLSEDPSLGTLSLSNPEDYPLSRFLEDSIVNTLYKGSVATEKLPTKCVVSQQPSPIVAEVCYSPLSREQCGLRYRAFQATRHILYSSYSVATGYGLDD
jgi:hypothetical protein